MAELPGSSRTVRSSSQFLSSAVFPFSRLEQHRSRPESLSILPSSSQRSRDWNQSARLGLVKLGQPAFHLVTLFRVLASIEIHSQNVIGLAEAFSYI